MPPPGLPSSCTDLLAPFPVVFALVDGKVALGLVVDMLLVLYLKILSFMSGLFYSCFTPS